MASQGLQLEDEFELEDENEEFLGNIGSILGKVSGLLGEGEDEFEDEFEAEDEYELEEEYEDEDFLGPVVSGISGLLGEGEYEDEDEFEDEDEAEQFFGGIGRWLKKAAPILKSIAKTAGPLVATAVGGPAAGALARAVTSQLEGEDEFEDEDEAEFEAEFENAVSKSLTGSQALAELMAAQATTAQSEGEAEALIGAASIGALSTKDRQELAALIPHLVSGAAVLTRLLYGSRGTRQALRTIPTIVDETAGTISRRLANGEPVSRAEAGQIMGRHANRLLASPRKGHYAMRRHYRGVKRAHGTGHRHHGAAAQHRTRAAQHPYATGRRAHAVRGQAVRSGVTTRAHTGRPRPGTMRVVTPVRVPGRGGHPARTVKVVTDVRVPRGAVPAAKATVHRAAPTKTPTRRAR